jgi:type IV secretory pathway VirB3-like protein
MKTHPIYAAINKPLLLLGVDRRVLALSIAVVLASLNCFHGLLGFVVGGVVGVLIYLVGRVGAARDPQFVSLLLIASKLRRRYDAGRV